MELLQHLDAMHAVAGFLVGVLVGLTGVGGGSLMTPLLVLMFGINPKTAVGTDLLYAAVTKLAGSAIHGWRETVDWKIMGRLASGSIPAAVITVGSLQFLGKIGASAEHVILLVLGGMLILTAIAAAFQRQIVAFALKRRDPDLLDHPVLATFLLGAAIGVLVSISSVGAGAIGVTALLMLYPGLPVSRIVGTDIAHAVPLVLVAGFGHWIIGDVDTQLLVNLLFGSIPGVVIGSLLSTRAPDAVLRPALAAVMFASGTKLLLT
jgi:uncharacterized membrane protein YfcA